MDICLLAILFALTAIADQNQLTVKTSSGEIVSEGDLIDKEEFTEAPTVIYAGAQEGEKYTLFVVDPDVPGYTAGNYWAHWVVANIAGEDFKNGNVQGDTLMSYAGPTPPPGGPHRYQFYVYQQPEDFQTISISTRSNFHLQDALTDMNLQESDKVASFYFKSQH